MAGTRSAAAFQRPTWQSGVDQSGCGDPCIRGVGIDGCNLLIVTGPPRHTCSKNLCQLRHTSLQHVPTRLAVTSGPGVREWADSSEGGRVHLYPGCVIARLPEDSKNTNTSEQVFLPCLLVGDVIWQ